MWLLCSLFSISSGMGLRSKETMQSYSYFSVYVNIQTHHIIHLHTIVRTHTHTRKHLTNQSTVKNLWSWVFSWTIFLRHLCRGLESCVKWEACQLVLRAPLIWKARCESEDENNQGDQCHMVVHVCVWLCVRECMWLCLSECAGNGVFIPTHRNFSALWVGIFF